MKCLPCESTKNVVKKAGNIGKAWINVVIENSEVEKIAVERLDICNGCLSRVEFMKINGNPLYKCKECSCPLIALVRSEEKCKLNKW